MREVEHIEPVLVDKEKKEYLYFVHIQFDLLLSAKKRVLQVLYTTVNAPFDAVLSLKPPAFQPLHPSPRVPRSQRRESASSPFQQNI